MLSSKEKYQYYKVYSRIARSIQPPREIGVIKVCHCRQLRELARLIFPVNSREILLFNRIHNTCEGFAMWERQCREREEFSQWMMEPAV